MSEPLPEPLRIVAWNAGQYPGDAKAQQRFQQELEAIADPAVLVALADHFSTLPEVAVPVFERLHALSPRNVGYLVQLGFAHWFAGNDATARDCLHMAQDILPDDIEAMHLEAALARSDDDKRAIYTRMLDLQPKNRVAWDNLLMLRKPEDLKPDD